MQNEHAPTGNVALAETHVLLLSELELHILARPIGHVYMLCGIHETVLLANGEHDGVSSLAATFTLVWNALASGCVARTCSRATRRSRRRVALTTGELVRAFWAAVAEALTKSTSLQA